MRLEQVNYHDELIQVVQNMLIEIEGINPVSLQNNESREIPTVFYLGYIDNEAVCVIETFFEGVDEIFLTNFGILEKFQRQGLGKQYLEAMENKARKLGYKALRLTSLPDSYGFYLKCGYYEHGRGQYGLCKNL